MNYIPIKSKILEKEQLTDDVWFFKVKSRIKANPGEFVQVSLLGVGEFPVSICSQEKGKIGLMIRHVGRVTKKVCSLKKNDYLFIRGPYGRGFPIEDKKIILIGGGTGIASLVSVINYVKKDLTIFFCFRNAKQVLFKNKISKWKKKFRTIISIDKKEKGWKGEVGLITNLLDKYELDNNSLVFICGPPIMIEVSVKKLKELGFKDENIYLSLERRMECGFGKCGRCMVHGKYTCLDGPIFRYSDIKEFKND